MEEKKTRLELAESLDAPKMAGKGLVPTRENCELAIAFVTDVITEKQAAYALKAGGQREGNTRNSLLTLLRTGIRNGWIEVKIIDKK